MYLLRRKSVVRRARKLVRGRASERAPAYGRLRTSDLEANVSPLWRSERSWPLVVAVEGGLLDLDRVVDSDLAELSGEGGQAVDGLRAGDDSSEDLFVLAIHIVHDRCEAATFVLGRRDRRHLAIISRRQPRLQRVSLRLQLIILL